MSHGLMVSLSKRFRRIFDLKTYKMKVYHDGENWVAKHVGYRTHGGRGAARETDLRMIGYLMEALQKRMTREKVIRYVRERFLEDDPLDVPSEEAVRRELFRFLSNRWARLARFKKKIFGNEWNYFITITYDDKKWSDPDQMEHVVRQTFQSFHSRHDWRYIGVWEHGELGGRTHFHCVAYIPKGKMVGELFTDKQYSTKRNRWDFFVNNTYFQERFGKAQFDAIDKEQARGRVMRYLMKYIAKSNDRFVYSRGLFLEALLDMDPKTEALSSYMGKTGMVYVLPRCFFGEQIEDEGFAVALSAEEWASAFFQKQPSSA